MENRKRHSLPLLAALTSSESVIIALEWQVTDGLIPVSLDSPEVQDIVMLRVYVVDATTEAFQQVITALSELIGDAMPSITTIGVQALYTPEIKVEIEMAVRVP